MAVYAHFSAPVVRNGNITEAIGPFKSIDAAQDFLTKLLEGCPPYQKQRIQDAEIRSILTPDEF